MGWECSSAVLGWPGSGGPLDRRAGDDGGCDQVAAGKEGGGWSAGLALWGAPWWPS